MKNPPPPPEDRLTSKEEKARKLIRKIGIPPQPQVVVDLFREIQNPNTSIQTIVQIVGRDPSLCAKAIKVVNSPLYGMALPISSIHQAITMLGLRGFHQIILVSALKEALNADRNNPHLKAIWRHMVLTARAAEFIAKHLKHPTILPDQAYLAGLFHDCALPLLESRFPGYTQLFINKEVSLADLTRLEEEKYEFNHAIIGSLMARTWNLPRETSLAIAHHHEISLAEVSHLGETTLWFILRLADYLGDYLAWQKDMETFEYFHFEGLEMAGITQEILDAHGLSPADVETLLSEVTQAIGMEGLNS